MNIFGFLNSPKRGKKFVYKTFANPASQDKKLKAYNYNKKFNKHW